MKRLLFIFFIFHHACFLLAQNSDTLKTAANADDPSQFITRIEVYNELQYYDVRDFYLNQTVFRAIVKLGKRFTTRIDVPYVFNSLTSQEKYQQLGLGDISFRLLGYKLFEKPKSAFTASIEVSLNTAESRLLGVGKNVVIPMVTYSLVMPKNKMLFSLVLQQFNSVSGDEARSDISFSKLQVILLKKWSRRYWTVLAPEWFFDYVRGGVSMNLRTRMTCAPTPRTNLWVTPSIGVFGDFAGRYQWSADIGGRFFLFREANGKKKNE